MNEQAGLERFRRLASRVRAVVGGAAGRRAKRWEEARRLSGRLDEFGFPVEWRNPEPFEAFGSDLAEEWTIWENWCDDHGKRAFPAPMQDLLEFLADPPVSGQSLNKIVSAVGHMHRIVYWNINANPADTLRLHGLHLMDDGTMFVPPPKG